MIEKALRHYPVNLAKSFIVGDKTTDLNLAGAEMKAILVRTGQGETTLQDLGSSGQWPKHVAKDLSEAIDLIFQLKKIERHST